VGRVSLYRLTAAPIEAPDPATEAPRRHLVAVGGTGGGACVATIAAPIEAPEREPVYLADLVARLSAALARVTGERDEAVGLAFVLADEAERLAADAATVRTNARRLAEALAAAPWYAATLRARVVAALRCL